ARRPPGHLRLPPPEAAGLRAPQPDEDFPLSGGEAPGGVARPARPPPGPARPEARPRRAGGDDRRNGRPAPGVERRPAGGRADAVRRRPRPAGHRRRPRGAARDREVPPPLGPRAPSWKNSAESMNFSTLVPA